MNQFYKGHDNKNLLKVLLKKGREENLIINVLCENSFIVDDVSRLLWNNSTPHFIKDDPYIEQNNIFVSEIEMPADMIICFENCNFKNRYKCFKKYFIGNYIKFEEKKEKYWIQTNNQKWEEVDKNVFFK